jgi:hypothetical protein
MTGVEMQKLKCWKRTDRITNPKSRVVYENIDGNRLIFILDSELYNDKPIRVGGVNKRGYIKDEYFKNESQALNFAQEYMKNHDRC